MEGVLGVLQKTNGHFFTAFLVPFLLEVGRVEDEEATMSKMEMPDGQSSSMIAHTISIIHERPFADSTPNTKTR